MNYIVGIGEVLWDVFPQPQGKKLGGAPCNFAFHVSQLGFNGLGVSAVGDDELGRELLADLSAAGSEYNIETVGFPTGTVAVSLDLFGIPQYEICEGVAWDNIEFTDQLERIAKSTRAVCFGSLAQRNEVSRSTIMRFLGSMTCGEGYLPGEQACKGSLSGQTYRIFDINLRQHYYTKEVIEESLTMCNVLKINDDEIRVVAEMFGYGETDFEHICRRLMRDFRLGIVILTCGAVGSFVFTNEVCSYLQTPKVQVVDTVGAGDSFTAAFTAALLAGKSIEFAHKLAVDVSAFICTQSGAMPQLPAAIRNSI